MVQYKARFVGQELVEEYPKVEIMTPEGRTFHWGDERLTNEIEHKTKRKISLHRRPMLSIVLNWRCIT